MQKKIFAVYRQGSVTDQMCQKWFVKFRAGDFSLDNGPWLHRPAEVNRDQSYTMQEIADILNIQINKVIGENEKCVFYFTEGTKRTFWPTTIPCFKPLSLGVIFYTAIDNKYKDLKQLVFM